MIYSNLNVVGGANHTHTLYLTMILRLHQVIEEWVVLIQWHISELDFLVLKTHAEDISADMASQELPDGAFLFAQVLKDVSAELVEQLSDPMRNYPILQDINAEKLPSKQMLKGDLSGIQFNYNGFQVVMKLQESNRFYYVDGKRTGKLQIRAVTRFIKE